MVSKAYRIGLGATVLARGLASGGHLDGIGVYTRELLNTLKKSEDAIKAAPVVFGSSVDGIDGYPKKHFSLSFELSSGMSYLSGLSTPGAADIERNFDLFHAPDHCIPRLRRIPLLASIMDVITLTKPDYVKSSMRSLKSAVFSQLAKKAQHIITISEYSALEIEQVLGIARERITVTPLGVNQRYFDRVAAPLRESVLTRYALTRPYFLAVGTLQTRKNVDRILDAYERLPTDIINSFDLVVAGRARPDMVSLTQRLAASRTRGNVKWIQYVPDEDLPALLQSAVALVFPSLYEGFGLPVIEAFASRIPVVTSNTTSLPEVAGDAAILVDPLAVEEISAGMQRVVESPEAMLSLVERGYARASEFTWERTSALTAQVYRALLS